MREFNDEQLKDLGRLVAGLFKARDDGEAMLASIAAEQGVTVEEVLEAFSVDEAAVTFEMKDDSKTYKLSLALAKTAEEELLEMLPPGSEVFDGGRLIAIPDPIDEDEE